MSASPARTLVTIPLLLTVAMAVFDEDHVASVVTLAVVPFDSVAVNRNCALAPTTGAVPLTETDETVAVGLDTLVGDLD
jgi:hypothetical protein